MRPDVSSEDMASTSPIVPSPLSKTSSFPQDGPASPIAPESSTAGAQNQASIEQSVRLFRLYEALRGGDTAVIQRTLRDSESSGGVEGTSVLHLAVQCADMQVIEYVLTSGSSSVDVNIRDKDGNTALHIASTLGRAPVVRLLLQQKTVNDSMVNYHGQTALDLAKNPDVFQQLQLARSMYIDSQVREVQRLVAEKDYDTLENLLADEHFKDAVDVDGGELPTDTATTDSGGTLLHEAARNKDVKLIQMLLLNGADPFRRDKRGRLAQGRDQR